MIIILADTIFFSTVFLQLDGTTQKTPQNISHTKDWVTCMVLNGGEKDKCLDVAKRLVVSEGSALAVLFLLSVSLLDFALRSGILLTSTV